VNQRIVEFAPEALEDVQRIYDWIASAAGPETAFSYYSRIERFCRGMAFGAERGHNRSDIRPGLRIVGFQRRITIAFTVTETRVLILRVFYGGRDWERLLE
jgi:toxin ParE1/3/4